MKQLMIGVLACAMACATGCKKETAQEAADIVCKAMAEKDIETLVKYSQCEDADFEAFYDMIGDQPTLDCSDFTVERVTTVVHFKVKVNGDEDAKEQEGRLTFYNQDGQWKCIELDKAKMIRIQRDRMKEEVEKVKAAEAAAAAVKAESADGADAPAPVKAEPSSAAETSAPSAEAPSAE